MSPVKKTAKISLYIFSFLVLLLVGGAIYIYINMDSIAKQITEQVASDAIGVPVKIGGMDISLEKKSIIVSDVRIANPSGYKNSSAITVKKIEIAGESFSKELLSFSRIVVDGTNVNLEVGTNGTNLGDIKNNIASKSSAKHDKKKDTRSNFNSSKDKNIKVIIKKFSLTGAQINPSVTLLGGGDIAKVRVPDIKLYGIGQKENGIIAKEAIAQIMDVVLQKFNDSASGAGFLKGVSVDIIKDIGSDKVNAIKGKLTKELDAVKGLKGLFE